MSATSRPSRSTSRIKTHLAAVKHYTVLLGYQQQISSFPRLYMLTRAIKRTLGNSRTKLKRSPITIAALINLKHYLTTNFNTYNQYMLWAAFTTAFFGFLRSAEFVAPTTITFDPEQTLLINDVTQSNNHISLISKR